MALCVEFPSLSWLAKTPEAALKGIQKVVADAVIDMQTEFRLGVQKRDMKAGKPQHPRYCAVGVAWCKA